MFIPHLRIICLTFIISLYASVTFAEIYKWTDENGQVNYSQQAPRTIPSEVIKAPPPPAVDPNIAQQKLDHLINQQQADEQMGMEQRMQDETDAENQQRRESNCRTAQHNLQQYQNNPGRKMIDAEGNVTRPTEEQRQQKIMEAQENIDKYCQ